MSDSIMKAVSGRELGSRASKRLRNEGLVPVTLYGKNQETQMAAVNARELVHLVAHRQVVGAILEVELDGKVRTTLVKEIQRHPVRRNLLHIDLQVLDAKEAVSVTVQLIVHDDLELVLENVEVSGPASSIPVSISIDATMLVEGVIYASAIKLGKGLEVVTEPETIVAKEAGGSESE